MRNFILFLALFTVLFITGCSIKSVADEAYPMMDIVYDDYGNKSEIFRAYNTKIDKVTDRLIEEEEPIDYQTTNEKIVLIYDDYLVQVYPDIENEEDTLIEVSEEGFVQNNYASDFFDTYELSEAAADEFDFDEGNSSGGSHVYTGYVGTNGYVKNTGSAPSVRGSTAPSNAVRGGGPGSGK
ncbi:DUF4247 domain-containing protein [Gracilibacillus oryzae]|uniref:DUF4247 domain-containing protein n=1 Tax=Gracilibacillus oryzae TaxID=1672701 RepID=UPI0018864C22|nr:DUF4247 domain-containing protein [Gracilibacillus oryzae]